MNAETSIPTDASIAALTDTRAQIDALRGAIGQLEASINHPGIGLAALNSRLTSLQAELSGLTGRLALLEGSFSPRP